MLILPGAKVKALDMATGARRVVTITECPFAEPPRGYVVRHGRRVHGVLKMDIDGTPIFDEN